MATYKYLLFDADNTIWDFTKSEVFSLEKAFNDFGIPYKGAYLDTYKDVNHRCWSDFEKGLLSQDKLRTIRMELLFIELGMNEDFVAFSKQYQQNLADTDFMIDGAMKLIETLATDFKLVLITNGLKEIQRARLKNTNIEPYFDPIVISDEIGVAKPHQGFFDYTFEQIGHPDKSETLVIGDNLGSDIKGGVNYGVDTCWYNPNGKLKSKEIVPTYEIKALEELYEIVK